MTFLHVIASVIETNSLPKATADQSSITKILDIVYGVAGSMALLMIVIGGFRYITAQADPNEVAKARSTIIYALVGLVITMAAYSITLIVINGVA